jgi:hypothetical protein
MTRAAVREAVVDAAMRGLRGPDARSVHIAATSRTIPCKNYQGIFHLQQELPIDIKEFFQPSR